jgi:N6-adenosine-specific RNA methylase IME4
MLKDNHKPHFWIKQIPISLRKVKYFCIYIDDNFFYIENRISSKKVETINYVIKSTIEIYGNF